jgi:threonine synthase
MTTRQRCTSCGHELAETAAHTRCPQCRGLLEVLHDAPAASGAALQALFDARAGSGVWRFAELVLPRAAANPVTYPEGNTPLIPAASVARWAGSPGLLLKHEGLNPTGSFKDRGMTVGVTQALRVGARAVACASTGNTGASLAAYAARAGLPAILFVPRGQVALGKVAQAVAHGGRTLVVRGNFDRCLELVDEASVRLGIYLLNSINPFRLEGQKTIMLEALQQLGWNAPDWIALPAGNLGNTAAFGKALVEARAYGLIAKVPRLAAIQAAGAAPFAASFKTGFARLERVEPHTVATAINIGNPASYTRAVRSIRETNGVVTAVSDDELMEAKAVVDAAGVGCEPASATSVAGVRQLVRDGVIKASERVVAVLTGHVLKDPAAVTRYHQETEPRPPYANRPVEVGASLEEVEKAMDVGGG